MHVWEIGSKVTKLLPHRQIKYPVDFDDELKIGDVRCDDMTYKWQWKYNSFDVYHMKHNYVQKWTVSEQSAIKKRLFFFKKSPFLFFIKWFLHTFCQKRTFCYPTTFFESLITHKRFIVEESSISYGKLQKSCTLIVILVKCLYLTSPIFNSSAKSNRTFYLPGRK